MADPWSILGLEPDIADEKQVRSAYARLLKVHRPDQDPEGFQRLRSAYEEALQWLRYRASFEEEEEDWADDDSVAEPSDENPKEKPHEAPRTNLTALSALPTSWADGETPVLPHKLEIQPPSLPSQPPPLPSQPPPLPSEEPLLPSQPPPLPVLSSSWEDDVPFLPYKLDQSATPDTDQRKQPRPERDWPREWSYSLESLDRALLGTPRHLDAVSLALRALLADVMEYGIPPSALECILSDAFDTDAGLFGMTAPVTLLSYLLQGGCTGSVKSALNALAQADNQAHLLTLVQKLDDCLADALSPRTAEVFFRAAILAALHRPFIAQSILYKLQRLLDSSAVYSPKYDRLLAAIKRGMALSELEPVHRTFWSQRLEHPESACDWQADPAKYGLFAVVLRGHRWAGGALVKSVVPPEVWKAAWKDRWVNVAVFQMMKWWKPRTFMVVGIAIVGGGLLIFGAHLSTKITPAPKPVPSPRYDPALEFEEYKRNNPGSGELFNRLKKQKVQDENSNPSNQ